MSQKVIELEVPDIGDAESIELVEWHIKEGQAFKKGDELCDLVTDKAAFSLEASQDGQLIEIIISNKKNVVVGEKVARVRV